LKGNEGCIPGSVLIVKRTTMLSSVTGRLSFEKHKILAVVQLSKGTIFNGTCQSTVSEVEAIEFDAM